MLQKRQESRKAPFRRPALSRVKHWNARIRGAAEKNMLSVVRTHVYEMIELDIFPDTETYAIILQIYAQGGYYKEAWALLGDMEAVGVPPDKACLDAMLHVSVCHSALILASKCRVYFQCVENVPEGLYPILQTMNALNLPLDATSYHHIIAHHANFLNVPMCLRTLDDMRRQGITPKIETADILVSAASKAKLPKLAVDVALLFESQSTRKLEGRTWMRVLIASADVLYVSTPRIFSTYRPSPHTFVPGSRCSDRMGTRRHRGGYPP